MKALLIAAGVMTAMLGAVPVSAAPVGGNAPAMAAPQHRDGYRDDRRGHDRGDRWANRGDRRWGNHRARCHNVRRNHRWVRVCDRRWR